jgi:hypothetical protein
MPTWIGLLTVVSALLLKENRPRAIILKGLSLDGASMTADTTFKEFVEESGISFCLLEFDSREYRRLVRAFNRAKLKLEAEAEATENAEIRARLMLVPHPQAKYDGHVRVRSEGQRQIEAR